MLTGKFLQLISSSSLCVVVCVIYPDVLKPVRLVNSRVPVGFIYGGINHVLHLPQRLPHHMDVGDFQEVQLHVWVETLIFIPSVLCLYVVEE